MTRRRGNPKEERDNRGQHTAENTRKNETDRMSNANISDINNMDYRGKRLWNEHILLSRMDDTRLVKMVRYDKPNSRRGASRPREKMERQHVK